MSVATQQKERVTVYEHKMGLRFIPNLCPSCPNFKGNSTCLIHLTTVQKDEEKLHVHGIAHLNKDDPYERMSACKLLEEHPRVRQVDQRTKRDINPHFEKRKKLKEELLEWMRQKSNLNLKATETSFLSVLDAIVLFLEGDIDTLVEKHDYLIFNSRQNGFYSEPFNRFTGVGLFTSFGSQNKEDLIRELEVFSKYSDKLVSAINIAYKYAEKKEKKDVKILQWVNNFMNVARELLYPDIKVLGYCMSSQSWPYIGDMREALKEWTGFSEEELPRNPVCPDGWNKQCAAQHKVFDKEKEEFRKWAHKELTKQ